MNAVVLNDVFRGRVREHTACLPAQGPLLATFLPVHSVGGSAHVRRSDQAGCAPETVFLEP